MALDKALRAQLVLPAVCAPMFLVSKPVLAREACLAGLIGALPRANAPTLTHGMPVRVRVKPGANPPVFLGGASRID